jgi:hypothetical protein
LSHFPGIGKTQAFVVVAGAAEDFVSEDCIALEDAGVAVLETLSDSTAEVLEVTPAVEWGQ